MATRPDDALVITSGKQGKGRSFEGVMLASVKVPAFAPVPSGNYSLSRPAWALVGATEGVAGPIAMNLRMGNRASVGNRVVEFPPRLGYRLDRQLTPEGSLLCLYLPEFFAVDPGMIDPESVQFCLLLERKVAAAAQWSREQVDAHIRACKRFPALEPELLELVPYFALYMDRRSYLPLPRDLRFHGQLLASLLNQNGAGASNQNTSGRAEVDAKGLDRLGMLPALVVNAGQKALAEMFAYEVKCFVNMGAKLQ